MSVLKVINLGACVYSRLYVKNLGLFPFLMRGKKGKKCGEDIPGEVFQKPLPVVPLYSHLSLK